MNAVVISNQTCTTPSGYPYVNEWRELPNGILVHKFNIAGAGKGRIDLAYDALEPTDLRLHQHSSFSFVDAKGGKPYGYIRTRGPTEDEIRARPASQSRGDFVTAWYARQAEREVAAVSAAFPEDIPQVKF